jgi:hypothetical protein
MTIRMLRMFEVLCVGMAFLGSCAAENAASGPGAGTEGTAHHQILQRAQGSHPVRLVQGAQLSAATLSAVSDEDLDGVEQTLETYQAAFENLSLPQMRRIWPNLDRHREAKFKEAFWAFRQTSWTRNLVLQCVAPTVVGETIKVECGERLTYGDGSLKPKEAGPIRIAITLRKQSSAWVIENMQRL